MLFAAISTKVPRSDMDVIHGHYEEFKVVNAVFLLRYLVTVTVPNHRAKCGVPVNVRTEGKHKQARVCETAKTDRRRQAAGFYSSEAAT